MTPHPILLLLKEWWWVVSVPGTLVLGLALMYLRTQFPTKGEFSQIETSLRGIKSDLDGRYEQVDKRLIHLEAVTESLPNFEEIQNLSDRIAGVEKNVAVATETVRSVETMVNKVDRTTNMILQNLLDQKQG